MTVRAARRTGRLERDLSAKFVDLFLCQLSGSRSSAGCMQYGVGTYRAVLNRFQHATRHCGQPYEKLPARAHRLATRHAVSASACLGDLSAAGPGARGPRGAGVEGARAQPSQWAACPAAPTAPEYFHAGSHVPWLSLQPVTLLHNKTENTGACAGRGRPNPEQFPTQSAFGCGEMWLHNI